MTETSATPIAPPVTLTDALTDAVKDAVKDAVTGPAKPLQTPVDGVRAALGSAVWFVVGGAAVLLATTIVALVLAWTANQRIKALEPELVKRQQDAGSQATEARTLAREAETTAREVAAKMALVEARVAETSIQRTQLEDLIQSLARSRDENVLADIEAAIRVALQQAAITGSAEPMVLTLKQADERLARYDQPRLERVRRAVAQDLERTRGAGVTDVTVLTIRLDEVIRQVDDLPLQSAPERRPGARDAVLERAGTGEPAATGTRSTEEPAAAASSGESAWSDRWSARWQQVVGSVWQEIKSLVRVTRIDNPEGMLVAPEQAFFLRENLKLRLLNARLALMSRHFETAQSDLRDAQGALDRYFDRSVRRVAVASESLRVVASQARLITVPRPDATLAAIATASAGR